MYQDLEGAVRNKYLNNHGQGRPRVDGGREARGWRSRPTGRTGGGGWKLPRERET